MSDLLEKLKEKIFQKFQKDSWEIKTLGEIATDIYIGSEVRREELGSGDHPTIKCGDVTGGLPLHFTKCISFINPDLVKRKKYFEFGDILIGKIGDEKTSGKACAYLGKEKCLLGDAVYALKHNQNPKYLAYVLSTEYVRRQIRSFKKASTVFNFFPREIKQIKIPLPPHEIQNQIVDFLDKFRSLEIEWEKESEKRKNQYEYYKELVFNREQNWPLKSLGEITEKIYRKDDTITHTYKYPGDYPALTGKTVFESLMYIENCEVFVDPTSLKKSKYIEKGDLVMFVDGFNNLGKTALYLGEKKCLLGNSLTLIKHNQNPKYLINALTTQNVKEQIKSIIRKGVVSHIYVEDIKKLKIPFPPLDEQEKIVEVLDRLYWSTNEIRENISFLIQKNREQYEFYRELLLEK